MATVLLPVRLYTDSDVYHFTTDNRPLQDLIDNDNILAAAVDAAMAAATGSSITITQVQNEAIVFSIALG